MSLHLKRPHFQGIFQRITPESEQSLWFLSYVLFAMEQLVLSNRRWFGLDSAWRANVEDQLGYHADLLRVAWPEWREHYSPKMDEIVRTVLSREFDSGVLDIGASCTSADLGEQAPLPAGTTAKKRNGAKRRPRT
jgi:hypothetical protein